MPLAHPIAPVDFPFAYSKKTTKGSRLNVSFAVVIRCLLRPSDELRRAMEMLNRYIDRGRKRDQTTDLRGIENS